MKIFALLIRLIQLSPKIISGKINNALNHYKNPSIVKFYREKMDGIIFPDEIMTLDFLSEELGNSLVYGCGTGRECGFLKDRSIHVWGYDPNIEMIKSCKNIEKITYLSNLKSINGKKFDLVWVTKNLPSLLLKSERIEMYNTIISLVGKNGIVVIKPDLMELKLFETFKFKIAEYFLKLTGRLQELGDTLRVNLDFNAENMSISYYHYYPSEESFEKEILSLGLKFYKLESGFYLLKIE